MNFTESSVIKPPKVSTFGMRKGEYMEGRKGWNKIMKKYAETDSLSVREEGSIDDIIESLELERWLAIAMDLEEGIPNEKFEDNMHSIAIQSRSR